MVALSIFTLVSALFLGAQAAPVAETGNIINRGFEIVGAEQVSDLSRRATPINYNQNYIASGAGVTYTPNQSAGSFKVSYNTQADFVVGLGWSTGNTSPITFSGSFSATGVGLLSVYGWSTNPLVEYYIMEESTGYPKSGTKMGTVTSDGSSYEIWKHTQTNQPSIQGTTTFTQFISVSHALESLVQIS